MLQTVHCGNLCNCIRLLESARQAVCHGNAVQEHPAWQVLLIDLRSHGDSSAPDAASSTSSVDTAAIDVLQLLRHLRLFPHMLVGHSFGGKVVLSMVEQFGRNLPRPISAWVLDTVPGIVNAGVVRQGQVSDHPRQLIQALLRMPTPLPSRQAAVEALQAAGFSDSVAKWVSTNLKPARAPTSPAQAHSNGSDGQFNWGFDLPSIAEMYDSYEAKSHWDLLADPPQGLSVHFVRAEHSNFRWQGGDADKIEQLGHQVHLLQNAGHWVHTDNPQGLLNIMERGLGHRDDVKHITRSYQAANGA